MKIKTWLWLGMAALLPAAAMAQKEALARFAAPTGMIYDGGGALHVSEWGADRVVRIRDGKREEVARGIASPAGLAIDGSGNLYVAGYGDGNIYRLGAAGAPEIIAKGFAAPTGLLWTPAGLLVANRNAGEVIRLKPNGAKEVVSRGHAAPVGIAMIDDGSLFVSCYGGSVDMIKPDGSRVAISKGLRTPGVGIVQAGADSVHVVDYGAGSVLELDENGVKRKLASGLGSPVGLAKMPDGNLRVGLWSDGSTRAIDLGGANGQ